MRNYKIVQAELTDLNWDGMDEETVPNVNTFKSFVSRMWLDNCDENKAFGAVPLSLSDYETNYKDWLKEKWRINNGNVDR